MVKNLKKFFIAGAAIALSASVLAGCSALKDASQEMGDSTVNILNNSSVVRESTDVTFNEFTFLGADFDRVEGSTLDVDVSGVAKYNEMQNKAYITMNYNLDDSFFAGIDSNDKAEIVRALNQAMQQNEMQDFTFVPINSVKALNESLKGITESPLKDFRYNGGLVFALGDVNVNMEEGYASFQLKSHVDYVKTETQVVPSVIYVNGKPQVGVTTKVNHYYENFLHTNDVYVRATEQELAAMENDSSLIIDKFIEYVNNNDKNNLVVNSVEVDKISDFDATMLKNSELYKNLD